MGPELRSAAWFSVSVNREFTTICISTICIVCGRVPSPARMYVDFVVASKAFGYDFIRVFDIQRCES